MRRSFGFVAALILAGVLAPGCEEATPPPDPTPTPDPVTERFSGTLTVNGAITFPFSANRAGTVTARLVTVAPDATTVLGLSIGTLFAGQCQTVIANDNATQNATVTGQASAQGSLCARVYDVGRLTGSITFEITVDHP